MKGALLLLLVVVVVSLTVPRIEAASRQAYVRYLNSMPQFGKAKFSASSPQVVVFDQVSQGSITDYSNFNARVWSFNTLYSTNVTATSDSVDLDSDAFATVITCQQSQRRLKNRIIFDTARSTGANVALLRVVNLAQFSYPVDVFNGSRQLFNNVPYCSASSYMQVPPGNYDFDWTISDFKKRQFGSGGCQANGNNCTRGGPRGGFAYTLFVTPTSTFLVQDAKKTITARNVDSSSTTTDDITTEGDNVRNDEVKEGGGGETEGEVGEVKVNNRVKKNSRKLKRHLRRETH